MFFSLAWTRCELSVLYPIDCLIRFVYELTFLTLVGFVVFRRGRLHTGRKIQVKKPAGSRRSIHQPVAPKLEALGPPPSRKHASKVGFATEFFFVCFIVRFWTFFFVFLHLGRCEVF